MTKGLHFARNLDPAPKNEQPVRYYSESATQIHEILLILYVVVNLIHWGEGWGWWVGVVGEGEGWG